MLKALATIYLIWGMNWVVMKTANTFFPPITFVAYRFLLGSIVLFLVWRYLKLAPPPKKLLPWIILIGLLQMGLNNIAAQMSMLTLGAGMVAVLNYSMPVFAAIIASFVLGERLTFRKGLGIAIAVVGMAVLMNVSAGESDYQAVIVGLFSALFWALASVLVKLKLSSVNAITLTTWQMIAAAIMLMIYITVFPQGAPAWSLDAVLCLIYNGILASALAFFLWSYVLQRIEVSKAAVAVLAVPVVGVIGGILFLNEPLTLRIILGMAIIMLGIYTVVNKKC